MNSYLSGFKRVKKRSLEFFLETELGLPVAFMVERKD